MFYNEGIFSFHTREHHKVYDQPPFKVKCPYTFNVFVFEYSAR